MKKNFAIFLLMILFFTIPLKAADDYLVTTGTAHDSTYVFKSERPFRYMYVDTMTFDVADGDSTINLGFLAYNAQIVSLNGAGDSGYVKIAFDSHKGFWHNDSVARNLIWAEVGKNSADDTFFAPIEFSKIYVRPVVGGIADSTATIKFIFFR